MPMIIVPRTKEVYKNKGKVYMFRRIREAVPVEGFVADGTLNPIWFHLHGHVIRRIDISPEKIRSTYKSQAETAEDWQIHRLIKVIFNKNTDMEEFKHGIR